MNKQTFIEILKSDNPTILNLIDQYMFDKTRMKRGDVISIDQNDPFL